jgi:hypothetical protein
LQNGKRILPDFVVNKTEGSCLLVEVKASYVLKKAARFISQIERLEVAKKEAEARGWAFTVWTEKELWS